MADATMRANQEWLAALRSQGPEREKALADLRSLLVRGLHYGLADSSSVTEADIEDFAQEALLKITANLDTFRGESRFTTWAQKIAIRVAFSELRRARWKDTSLQGIVEQYDEGDFTPALLTDASASPERQATQHQVLELVHRLIEEELTDRQRQAMTAIIFGGMNLEEVARRMDTNRNALYKLLYDARQRIKQRIVAHGLSPQEALAAFQ
jgi:RNA polymerase sigma-70 factor (ECF subfamily)